MQRVAIFGSPGSGKSTLARRLAALTGLPAVHLDQHYFQPGWITKDKAEFGAIMSELVRADHWITDGNYTSTSTERLVRADTLILLDCPRWRCMGRVLRRSLLSYGKVRPDQAPGCPERFDWEFLKFVWNFPAKTERIRQMLYKLAPKKAVFILRNKADVTRFLADVKTRIPA